MDILNNLPSAGIFDVSSSNATPSGWTQNKHKYIGNKPTTLTYGIFNYFILDLDIKNAKTPSIPKLLQHLVSLGIPVNTYMVKTKSGGAHLYYEQLDFAYASPVGWIKTEYGDVDVRGYGTWARGPTHLGRGTWQLGQYNLINDVPPIQFAPMALLENLKENNITALKKNAQYYLSMEAIPESMRNEACLQILEHWYRHGKSEEEIEQLFHSELSSKIENFDEFLLEYDIGYHYARARSKAEGVSPDGKEDKLVLAKRNYIYVMSKDMVYDSTTKIAYPRATFKYCIDNKYTYIDNQGEEQSVSLVDVWIVNKDAKKVVSTGWQPSDVTTFKHNGLTLANTYRDNRPAKVPINNKLVKMWLDVIGNVFMGDKQLMDIYISSVKWQLEHPLEPRTWSVTVIGTKGPGKGTLWKTLSSMLGNGMSVDPQHLKKEYNTFLFQHQTLLFDEMDTQASHQTQYGIRQGALKAYITENEHVRVGKGKDVDDFSMPTYYSVEIHANSTNGLKFDSNDRRHFLCHCTAESLHDRFGKEFLTEYYTALENGELGATLRSYLDTVSYSSDFDYTAPFKTKWFDSLCDVTKSDIARDIIDGLDQDNIFSKSDIQTVATIRQMLINIYEHPEAKTSHGKVGRAIQELVSDGRFKVIQERGSLPYKFKLTYNEIRKGVGRENVKLIAVRNLSNYMTPADAKKALYPHIPQDPK